MSLMTRKPVYCRRRERSDEGERYSRCPLSKRLGERHHVYDITRRSDERDYGNPPSFKGLNIDNINLIW
jgi:hypothetical protein